MLQNVQISNKTHTHSSFYRLNNMDYRRQEHGATLMSRGAVCRVSNWAKDADLVQHELLFVKYFRSHGEECSCSQTSRSEAPHEIKPKVNWENKLTIQSD